MTHEEILAMLGDYVDYLIANSSAEVKIFPPCGRRRRRTKISRCVWIRWWKRTTACSRSFTS